MVLDIWHSFRRMPLWVQIWVAVFLLPVNLMTVVFWQQPAGLWLIILAIGGMLPNLYLLAVERGFSKAMALSHIVLWPALLVLCLWLLSLDMGGMYRFFLIVLLLTDSISLAFDFPDAVKWWGGDRAIA